MPAKYIWTIKTFIIQNLNINTKFKHSQSGTPQLDMFPSCSQNKGKDLRQWRKCKEPRGRRQGREVFMESPLQYQLSSMNISDYLAWDKLAGEPTLQDKCWWGEFEAKLSAQYCNHYTDHKEHLGGNLTPSIYFCILVLICSFLAPFSWWRRPFVAYWKGYKICSNTDFGLIYFQKCFMPHFSRKFLGCFQPSERHSYSW